MHKYWSLLVIVLIIDHFVGLITSDTDEFNAFSSSLPEENSRNAGYNNDNNNNNKQNSKWHKRVRSEFVPVRGRKVWLNLDTVHSNNGYNSDAHSSSLEPKSIKNCEICPKLWNSDNNDNKRNSNLFMPMRGRRDYYYSDSDNNPDINSFFGYRGAKKSQFNPMRGKKTMQSNNQFYENTDNEKKRSEKFYGLRG